MNSSQATTWLTDARFEPYLTEAEGDHEHAVALYVWNAQVSAACVETLHHVEVLLRNTIDAQFAPVIAAAAPAESWLEDPQILECRLSELEGLDRPTLERVIARLAWHEWGHASSLDRCSPEDVAAGRGLLELAPEGLSGRTSGSAVSS